MYIFTETFVNKKYILDYLLLVPNLNPVTKRLFLLNASYEPIRPFPQSDQIYMYMYMKRMFIDWLKYLIYLTALWKIGNIKVSDCGSAKMCLGFLMKKNAISHVMLLWPEENKTRGVTRVYGARGKPKFCAP